MDQMRADEQARRTEARLVAPSSSSPAPGRQDEGYWAYMQRQVQERTENLGFAGDTMNQLGDSSAKFGDDVSKYVSRTKKKAVMGSKFCESLDVRTKVLTIYSGERDIWTLRYHGLSVRISVSYEQQHKCLLQSARLLTSKRSGDILERTQYLAKTPNNNHCP